MAPSNTDIDMRAATPPPAAVASASAPVQSTGGSSSSEMNVLKDKDATSQSAAASKEFSIDKPVETSSLSQSVNGSEDKNKDIAVDNTSESSGVKPSNSEQRSDTAMASPVYVSEAGNKETAVEDKNDVAMIHTNMTAAPAADAATEDELDIIDAASNGLQNGNHHHHHHHHHQYHHNNSKTAAKSPVDKKSKKREEEEEHVDRNHGHGNGHGRGGRHKHRKVSATADDQTFSNHEEDHDMDHDHDAARQPSDEKYRRLKRKLKQVLEENERLSNELDRSNRRARHLRQEKNLLLDRLCVYERDSDSSPDTLSSMSSDSDLSDSSVDSFYHARSRRVTPTRPTPQQPTAAVATSPAAKRHLKVPGAGKGGADHSSASAATPHHPKKTANKSAGASATGARKSPAVPGSRKEDKPVSIPSTITNVGSATQKPKRIHNTTKLRPVLSSKVRKVQAIERDEEGKVKLPVTVGIITIMDLGHVVYDRWAFHNERYIWPVGYRMSRSYNSMIDPTQQTTYTCSVVDDGEAPKFQIDAEDQPGKPIIAGTATGAWTHVVKAANLIRKRDHSNSASGPDYFGFSNATIAKMIQDLPNAEKCKTYIMQRYEEPSSSSAATSGRGGSGTVTGEKRKLAAVSKTGTGRGNGSKGGDDGEDQEDGAVEDGDESDSYASLGTPGKKAKRSTSPKIRQAGFGAKGSSGVTEEDAVEDEEADAEIEHDMDELEEEEEHDQEQHEHGQDQEHEGDEGHVGEVDDLEVGDEETLSDKEMEDAYPAGDSLTTAAPPIVVSIADDGAGAPSTAENHAESEMVEIEDTDTDMESAPAPASASASAKAGAAAVADTPTESTA
ncbi:hypothetical protein EDD11_008833 [Mortierella claussenii]|nr:hypothetical protein EDD11_008833 [Mortierella claussenii]